MAIAIGGNQINKAYLGSTEIQKMYLGSSLVFDNTIVPSDLKPIMTNFRVNEATPTHIHFDEPLGPATGLTTQGFTVSGKAVTNINTLIGYIEVDTPFTFWDNNTVKLESGNGVVYDFSLEPIVNNIVEPAIYSKTIFVADNGSDSNGGTSEGDAYLTLGKALQNTVANGNLINVKVGTYSDTGLASSTADDGTITNPTTISGYKVTPGDLDDQPLYYSYGDGAFDPTEMPLFDGGNRSTGTFMTVITSRYRIYKNLQFTGYAEAFMYAGNESRDGMIWSKCLFRNIGDAAEGGSGASNGRGIVFQNSNLTSNYVRIVDSFFENITATTVKTAGQHCAIINTQAYCNESSTNNTYAATDYYLQNSGSYGVVRNNYVYRNIDPSQKGHYGHGVVFKTEGSGNSYSNLSVDNEVVNVLGAYELRNMNSRYNVVKRCISRADVPDRYPSEQGTAGFKVLDGSRDNIIEQNTFHDLDIGWAIWRWDESGDEGSIILARNNTIKNNLFYNLKQFIAVNCGYGSVKSLPTDNKIYNNTIDNCDYMWDIYQGTGTVEFDSSNLFTNNAFSNITNEFRQNAPTGWTYDYNNWFSSYTNGIGSNATNVNPNYTGNYIPQTTMNAPKIVGVNYDGEANERADTTTKGKQEINGVTPTPPLTFEILSYEISEETTTTARVRATMTKNCSINYYVDTVKNAASSDDFDAFEVSTNEWRHNRVLTGLTPGTTANLIIEVTAQDNLEVIQSGNIPLTTLPDETYDYYVSELGDGVGTIEDPMSFADSQTTINSMTAGQSIAYKGGDVFEGQLVINSKSGITITSYGTGQAEITGKKDIIGWTNEGFNIWSSNTGADIVYQAFKDGDKIQNAKDDTKYTITSITNNFTTLQCDGLIGSIRDMENTTIFIKQALWFISSAEVQSFDSGTGTLTITSPSYTYGLSNDDEFWFYNSDDDLTTQNDWTFNNGSFKIYSTSSPEGIRGAMNDTIGIELDDSSVTFDNVKISGYNNTGFVFNNCSDISVTNSTIESCYEIGVATYGSGQNNFYFEDNIIADVMRYGINQVNSNSRINRNNISRVGTLDVFTYKGSYNTNAIKAYGTNTEVNDNIIDNIGYNGIVFGGTSMDIKRNTITNYCLVIDDGGAIYTFTGSGSPQGQYSNVEDNIITGTGEKLHYETGIYLDDLGQDIYVRNNTVTESTNGIYLHNSIRCEATDNKIYNCRLGLVLRNEDQSGNSADGLMVDNIVDRNDVYLESNNESYCALGYYSQYGLYNTYTGNNNNFYNYTSLQVIGTDIYITTMKTLAEWQSISGTELTSTQNSTREDVFTIASTDSANYITNSDFSSGIANWTTTSGTLSDGGGFLDLTASIGSARTVGNTGSNIPTVLVGEWYLWTLDIKADDRYEIKLYPQAYAGAYGNFGYQPISTSTTWETYNFLLPVPYDTASVKTQFYDSKSNGYQLDNVTAYKVTPGDNREVSFSAVNDTNSTANISLPTGTWYTLSGVEHTGTIILNAYSSEILIDKAPAGNTLGPELVTNGTFDDATGWTLNGGWSVDGNLNKASGTDLNYAITPLGSIDLTNYRMTFDCSVVNGGTGTIDALINGSNQTITPTIGFNTHDLLSGSNGSGNFAFYGNLNFSIDNLSIKEIL